MREDDPLIIERIKYLRDETDFIECLFDNLTEFAIVALDFDGNVIAFNEGAHQIFGYVPQEIIGKQRFEILFPEESDEISLVEQVISEMQKSGNYSYSNDMIRKNGERFPAKAVFTLTRNRNDQGVGVIGIVEDITERIEKERAEERVTELENEMNSLKNMLLKKSTKKTADIYGGGLLKDTVPDLYRDLVSDYSSLLDHCFDTKVYKKDFDMSDELQKYSEKLGFSKATARDVIEIHNSSIGSLSVDTPYRKTKEYINEGRFLLIELMGYLAMFYRRYSLIPSVSDQGN